MDSELFNTHTEGDKHAVYVFHVDSGTMLSFGMTLLSDTIKDLKLLVEKAVKIPYDKQVLLESGGECLEPDKGICVYGAGTDTNPYFLFSKSIIESPKPPPITSVDYRTDEDLLERLQEHCDLPASLSTVNRRCQLAQEFHKLAEDEVSTCSDLVRDQHLQQQGWAAVVANLEDITLEFRKRSQIFEKSFSEYINERESYSEFLKYFHNDLSILQKIPLLSTLLEKEKENPDSELAQTLESSESGKEVSLLDWISSEDSMDQLFEHCSRGLRQLDSRVFEMIKKEIDDTLQAVDNTQMKEVKGLSDRLYGLEMLMTEGHKYQRLQNDMAESFKKNKESLNSVMDQSVLPDLCASHKKQLQLMAVNHQHLVDIRHRLTKAKEELSINLYHRLKWVMYIEDQILEVDRNIFVYHENLKRLRRHLEVMQQIHLTPALYLNAVAEVVRRRAFSQSFLLWASELACHMLTIHNDETARRKEFQAQFEGHFLTSLFTGMEDLPPTYAAQAPSMFDSGLPKLEPEDLERLKAKLPELVNQLDVPDISNVVNFFLTRSSIKKDEKVDEVKAVEERLVEAVTEVGLASNLDRNLLKGTGSEPCLTTTHGLPHLKDLDRGCESETDTEEFEKVGQSPLELNFDKPLPSSRPGTQDASTSTEDNLQISKSEHEKLKSCLLQMYFLTKETMSQLRSELESIKTQVVSDKSVVSQHYESLGSSWETLTIEWDNKEKELVENIKKDHDLTVNDLRRIEQERNEKIQSLLSEKNELEAEVLKSCVNLNELQETLNMIKEENEKKIEELRIQLQAKDVEKEKNIKEVTDRLSKEHAVEINNLRSRYKLMTMERSPDSTEGPNQHHSMLLAQMKENFEIDKENAVAEAVKQENEKWEKILFDTIRELEDKFKQETEILIQEAVRGISEDKDKQITILTERERSLQMECVKYKHTIQQLTEAEIESNESELLEKINSLQKENERLEIELEKIKSGSNLSASVAVVEGKDATTSPIKQTSRGEISLPKSGKISFDGCKIGDTVIVLWDHNHESFQILQENKHMYFLHSDYLECLGLEVIDGKPNKYYCTGVVVDKEYCHARKSENRYKVPKGTKFFRVKVHPLSASTTKEVSRSMYHQRTVVLDSTQMSQSHATIGTITEIISEDKPDSHSLPSSPVPEYSTVEEERSLEKEPHVADVISVEKSFAEDSGIVDSIEQAKAAVDVADDNETSDR